MCLYINVAAEKVAVFYTLVVSNCLRRSKSHVYMPLKTQVFRLINAWGDLFGSKSNNSIFHSGYLSKSKETLSCDIKLPLDGLINCYRFMVRNRLLFGKIWHVFFWFWPDSTPNFSFRYKQKLNPKVICSVYIRRVPPVHWKQDSPWCCETAEIHAEL